MKQRLLLSIAAAAVFIAAGAAAEAPTPAPAAAHLTALGETPWDQAAITALGERVADYHIAQLAGGSAYPKVRTGNRWPLDWKGWEQGAFLIGLTEFAELSGEPRYRQMILQRGVGNDWKLGERLYHADDHMIGQTYFWARRNGAGDVAIAHMRENFDKILAQPSTISLEFDRKKPLCVDRWCWCDALFMAPAAWLEMAKVTGDAKYADFAKKEFWAATDYLWDESEDLYFRDSSFFEERDAAGRKLFWSRGNGWVFAGLARIIPLLPENDPDRPRFIEVYKKMAAKLKAIQKPDGYWSGSLLNDAASSSPESSGTGFYVYGMSWGINAGLLDRAAYEPVVRKGWTALVRSIHPDGRLGWVQPISDRPAFVSYDDTHDYGYGAFLLAASELSKLKLAAPAPVAAGLTVTNPSSFDRPAALVEIPVSALKGADFGAGASVRVGGVLYPAQIEPAAGGQAARLSFVLPLKARQSVEVKVYPQAAPLTDLVQASLYARDHDGGYSARGAYQTPAGHKIGDGQVAFEGAGWESDKAAYRIYLDERAATDVFGKRQPLPVLTWIGQGKDDYHKLADWGMDVLKVGPTLGIGAIGVEKDGKAMQAAARRLTTTVINPGPVTASLRVRAEGFAASSATVDTRYTIQAQSPVTIADVSVSGRAPTLATGVVKHPGVTVLQQAPAPGGWGYVASWGRQSLNDDDLGLVLFYRAEDVAGPALDDGGSLKVVFKARPALRYGFAALWSKDLSGVSTPQAFEAWVKTTAAELSTPVTWRIRS
ncbi:glycoside hydrolase family 88 protein [Caulobacter segnis]|uniref:glycoside hydrolase family 88 protein n=1 Tax=Caulobacter segnis TaxID=88688 RepID=UPI00240F4316|nr:glycoside hydrolase family 88 protein [Caulobacter segnis]MDG2520675.1 glycoside hydrolase family 88 protein [Caulobacter segnis]